MPDAIEDIETGQGELSKQLKLFQAQAGNKGHILLQSTDTTGLPIITAKSVINREKIKYQTAQAFFTDQRVEDINSLASIDPNSLDTKGLDEQIKEG